MSSPFYVERCKRFKILSFILLLKILILSMVLISCGGETKTVTETVTVEKSNGTTKTAPRNDDKENEASNASEGPKDSRASKYIDGNASPVFPGGEAGVIALVAQGSELDESGSLPIVVRNNTDETVVRIQASGTIRDASGNLVASGSDQTFTPNIVQPGEITLGYVYFDYGIKVPAGGTYAITFSSTPANEARFENILDLEVTEINFNGDKVLGSLKNGSEETVSGPIGVLVMCFDEKGIPLFNRQDFATPETLNPGATATFQVDLFDKSCPVFLLGGSGFSM